MERHFINGKIRKMKNAQPHKRRRERESRQKDHV